MFKIDKFCCEYLALVNTFLLTINGIHCISALNILSYCFDRRKFAPRCCVCKDPIVPEAGKTETVRVVALDRSFHVSCYKCEVSLIHFILYDSIIFILLFCCQSKQLTFPIVLYIK
jgi:hypothetical protein